MIAIVAFAIVAVVMAGLASYTVYSTVRSTETLTLVQRNVAQMDGLVATLKSNIRRVTTAYGGVYSEALFIPAPDVDNPATPFTSFIPSWIASNARTPWGASYGYCAYAAKPLGDPLSSGTASTPLSYNTTAGIRSAGTHLLTAPDGAVRLYVASGERISNSQDDPEAPAVLGFVISPVPNSSTLPSCDAVAWKGGVFRVSGPTPGTVVAIVNDVLTWTSVPVPTEMKRYVADGGAGDGGSPSAQTSLSAVLSEWKLVKPAQATLFLNSGNHTLSGSDFDLVSAGGLAGHQLRIVGSGPGATTIVNAAASASALSFESDLSIENVSLGPKVALNPQPGARLRATSSNLRYVYSQSADVVIGQGSTVSAAVADVPSGAPGEAAIDAIGGRVTLVDSGSKVIGGTLANALSMKGAVLTLNVASLAASQQGAGKWLSMSGGARLLSQPAIPIVYLNGSPTRLSDQEAMPQPDLSNASVSPAVTADCATSGDSCAAMCAGSDFLVSGGCSAGNPGASQAIAVTSSGSVATGGHLPNGWQCKFSIIPLIDGGSVAAVDKAGTATAYCGKLQSQ